MEHYSNEIPERFVNLGRKRQLNYNVRELTDEEIKDLWENEVTEGEINEEYFESHRYAYNSVEIGIAQWTRDGIINAIIRDKYPVDVMEAITNNMAAVNAVFMQTLVTDGIIAATKYLKDSVDQERSNQFKEMQDWRQMAKQVASEIIKPN